MTNILVLKLGALGNVVLSISAFAAIRQHHRGARITLLTTAPYAGWMAASPWFDNVLIDTRPAWWDLSGVLRLRRRLRDGNFDRVYDLQTSGRSSHYFRLFSPGARPEWSGIAPGCSHPDRAPDRDRIHDIDRQRGQLRQAGITDIPAADLSWCRGDIARFALPRRFALLAPGSAPHRLIKRWPAAHYRALASWLTQRGIAPVVIGTAGEHVLADEICAGTIPLDDNAMGHGGSVTGQAADAIAQAPWVTAQVSGVTAPAPGVTTRAPGIVLRGAAARDLTGQTSFGDLADLGRAAVMAIGNDTGPMHLLAAVGCPSLVLFSRDSDPFRCVPHAPPDAPAVRVLRRDDLATLTPDLVIADLMPQVSANATAARTTEETTAIPGATPGSVKATA